VVFADFADPLAGKPQGTGKTAHGEHSRRIRIRQNRLHIRLGGLALKPEGKTI